MMVNGKLLAPTLALATAVAACNARSGTPPKTTPRDATVAVAPMADGSSATPSPAASPAAAATPVTACEARRVLHTFAPKDRQHVYQVKFLRDDFTYLVIESGKPTRSVSGTGGDHVDIAPNTLAQLLADGRPIFLGKDGKEHYVSVDGQRGKVFDDVWYATLAPTRTRYAYAAKRGGKWGLVVDQAVPAAWYDSVDYPVFDAKGRVAAVVKKDKRQAVLYDGAVAGPWYDEIAPGPVTLSADGDHLLYAARIKSKWHLILDGTSVTTCRKLARIGFRGASNTPVAACQRKRGWVALLGDEVIGGPYKSAPWVTTDEGGRHLVVKHATELIVDGQVIIRNATRISAPRFSPDGTQLAVMVERGDHGRVEMWSEATGQVEPVPHRHPAMARDVLLGTHWGYFSADGAHFGYAVGGQVIVDGKRIPDGVRFHGFTASGQPVWESGFVDPTLYVGTRSIATARQFHDVHSAGTRVLYHATEPDALVAGCVEP